MMTEAGVLLARALARLPVSWVTAAGRGLGRLFWWLPNRRKAIARRNLDLCFPHWSKAQRRACLKANMVSTGQGLSELLLSWWRRSDHWLQAVEIEGFEHLEKALQGGQAPRLRQARLPVGHLLARQHNNKVLQKHVDTGRRAFAEKTIDKKDMKQVLASLRCLPHREKPLEGGGASGH